jgi:4-hydroxy-3-polyprenylbenzoate decarboxylase
MRLIVGMSGASGIVYGIRLLEILKELPDVETHLVMTAAARLTVRIETDRKIEQVAALADEVHNVRNIAASIASGSFETAGMLVVPCSVRTLSGIVNSYADDLLLRAADVVLKERRRLVLAVRESPLHTGHCRLLYEASKLGAIVAPLMPGLYTRPKTIDEMISQTVGRLLKLYDINTDFLECWHGLANPRPTKA